MTYYIEYTNIPTRHNTRQTIETDKLCIMQERQT